MTDVVQLDDILTYRLVQFRKRIVFDILYQRPDTIFDGTDDGDYLMFIASNGFQVISRSRMDIQTERLWLLGSKNDSHADRSGTMVFAMQEMCDKAYPGFHIALKEWADKVKSGDRMTRLSDFRPKPPVAWKVFNDSENGNNVNLFVESQRELDGLISIYGSRHLKITPLYE
jgi:hypothetical protein